nr:hypothetical protein [Deltaproteobacteria bacterium]
MICKVIKIHRGLWTTLSTLSPFPPLVALLPPPTCGKCTRLRKTIRAGIVERPEDYRWSSLGYHVQAGNKGKLLSLDFGLEDSGRMNSKERLRKYREFVYEAGALEGSKGATLGNAVLEQERQKGFELSGVDRFRYRTRYFTDSGVIGSKDYVRRSFQRFKHLFQTRSERTPKRVSGLAGVYSLRRLG